MTEKSSRNGSTGPQTSADKETLVRQGSVASGSSSSTKRGFRRSLSNVGDYLTRFGSSDSKRKSLQPEAASSQLSASPSTQTLDAAAGDRSRRRLSSLRTWGVSAKDDASSSSLPRSPSTSSYKGGFGESMRSFRQRASEFGSVQESSSAEGSTKKARPRTWFGASSSSSTAAAGPSSLPPTVAEEAEPVPFPSSEQADSVAAAPKETPATPEIVLQPPAAAVESPAQTPTKAPPSAPRLSFGGDQIVDDDWGNLSDKDSPPVDVSKANLTVEADDEARRASIVSDAPSSVGEIQEATRVVSPSLVKGGSAALVQVKDGEGHLIDPKAPLSSSDDSSLPAPPARAVSSDRSGASTPKKDSPIKRLISSDSWRKLSLSATDMSPSKSKASATETDGSAAETEKAEGRNSLDSSASSIEVPSSATTLEPPSNEMTRSTSITDSKLDSLARSASVTSKSLTDRLTTPGHRSSFGHTRASLEGVEASAFSRREGSVVDSLHRLSIGGGKDSANSSGHSSPSADRVGKDSP